MRVCVCVRVYNRMFNIQHTYSFRIGTQIPLYKGKNLCSLDPNNYRGITLLTCYNKLFEIVTWNRISKWWQDEQVISPLQGACTKGMSCLHTAAILQETIAVGLDTDRKVFVAYFDVAKAFDSVWVDGLFFQLRNMGLVGREWRMLYSSYVDFWCRAKLQDVFSDWYPMQCGIHQGGYLSLLKYSAFIDPLLRKIERSDVGCRFENIPACPLGYADDMAAACLSKHKLDAILQSAHEFSVKWEYKYNAKKSAVMIFGDNKREYTKGRKFRTFSLGKDKVVETGEYDHVGVENCLFNDFRPRTVDRISKGRRAFNAILNTGIKRKGLNMAVISSLYWSIIVPVVSYGCEVWVMRGYEIELLRKFQRYVGRKCQRFHQQSPNYSAYATLGWKSLEKVVFVKKLLFFRSICILNKNTLEDEEHQVAKAQLNKGRLLWQLIESPYYLTWWVLSDISRNNIEQFEIMARLVCGSSLLKECNPRYKSLSIASRFCEKCDLGIEESVRHIFMQCPFFENDKQTMFTELGSIED